MYERAPKVAALLAEADGEVEGAAQTENGVALVEEEEGYRVLHNDCGGRGHFRSGPEVAGQSGAHLQVCHTCISCVEVIVDL